jgi:hypothetical protein
MYRPEDKPKYNKYVEGVQPLGSILIVLGFIAAAAAGFWFALQMVQGTMQLGEAATSAGLLFIPIGALVLAGIYLRTRQKPVVEPESMVEKQRHLVDLLNVRGSVPVSEMAAALQVDEATLHELVEQLIRLEIFSGRVDWEGGMMYAAPTRKQLSD